MTGVDTKQRAEFGPDKLKKHFVNEIKQLAKNLPMNLETVQQITKSCI